MRRIRTVRRRTDGFVPVRRRARGRVGEGERETPGLSSIIPPKILSSKLESVRSCAFSRSLRDDPIDGVRKCLSVGGGVQTAGDLFGCRTTISIDRGFAVENLTLTVWCLFALLFVCMCVCVCLSMCVCVCVCVSVCCGVLPVVSSFAFPFSLPSA